MPNFPLSKITTLGLDLIIAICDIAFMMTLTDYIRKRELRQEDAANEIGISRSYLSEIMSRAKQPGRDTIKKIDTWSNGEVPPAVWFLPVEQQNRQQRKGAA
ncbi:helix-turn-helix domain-containing protein [Roseinatronobacter sp. NSM]|uniref:helix-turn-helix domain-containing protein n=1 Tax=Roseinatronobacter sp. NSM TaxID=3457785 RepID=UPI004036C3A5